MVSTSPNAQCRSEVILSAAQTAHPEVSDEFELLQSNPSQIGTWMTLAVEHLHNPTTQPERSAIAALSLLTEWLRLYICSRLLQVATPEALLAEMLVKTDAIPNVC